MSLEHQGEPTGSDFPYDLLTRDQVAQRLHVTPVTITRSYARWGLRPVRIGGRILFPSTQLVELERRLIKSGGR